MEAFENLVFIPLPEHERQEDSWTGTCDNVERCRERGGVMSWGVGSGYDFWAVRAAAPGPVSAYVRSGVSFIPAPFVG